MWEQIASNRRKSVFLVAVTAVLLMALGYALGAYFGGRDFGYVGLIGATCLWLIMTLVAYFQGDNVLLSLGGAKKVEKQDLPVLFNVVEEMTLAAGLPRMPAVYVIDDAAPNAFATGRRPENAAVAVTSGLLKRLNRDELQGVIAHEMAHVRNRDIQLMLFAGVLAGAIVILAEVGMRGMFFGGGSRSRRSSGDGGGQGIIAIVAIVLVILAPIMANLIYLAVSRKREYLADASAASFTRYPEGLASALEKISRNPGKLASANKATAPMYIINPLKLDKKKMAANSTSTHPPIRERIKILRAMGTGSFADYEESYRKVKGGKKGILPASALQEEPAAGTPRAATPESGFRVRAREVDDFLYKSSGYKRIECACGTVLKTPPKFTQPSLTCPRCGTEHALK